MKESPYATDKQVRSNLIRWVFRLVMLVLLYYFTWNTVEWIPITLYFTVPIMILSLVFILGYNPYLRRKMKRGE
jgi:hypothetical protein